jgi:hypothetical protein
MKLTVPQADLLVKVATNLTGYYCNPDYRPAKRLLELGLCDGKWSTFGAFKLVLTDEGRAEIERRAKG